MFSPRKIVQLSLLIPLILACSSSPSDENSSKKSSNNPAKLSTTPEDSISWLPNQYARLFRLGFNGPDTFLMVYFDSVSALSGYFWGKSEPSRYPLFKKIEARDRIASLSVSNTRFLKELNLLNQVNVVDRFQFHDPKSYPLKKQCKEIGDATGNINKEALVKQNIQLSLCNLVEMGSLSEWERIENQNHKVIFIQNFWEPHPLARAEWIRVFGYLFGKINESESMFKRIVYAYDSIRAQIPKNSKPIQVMINLPYSGSWMVPKRQNYMTQIVQDAGGNCLWLRNSANFKGVGSLQISMEQALADLSKCDVLLNPGSFKTKTEAAMVDSRIAKLSHWAKLPLLQNDLKLKANTNYNPFWDDGMLHPEKILSDMYSCFQEIQQTNSKTDPKSNSTQQGKPKQATTRKLDIPQSAQPRNFYRIIK
jgi:iron complex transport system substrate-binding protein